ncbi:hypothetical protein ABES58_24095 [Paenibacillus lautus]
MNIEVLFEQYGLAILFIGLMLEFIALPFPGEQFFFEALAIGEYVQPFSE